MNRRALIVIWLACVSTMTSRAHAQCVARVSSCTSCHETQNVHSVRADGAAWHADHAGGDFCQPCHGGNAQASDESAAHATLVAPLSDIAARCGPCHSSDAETRAARYRTIRERRVHTTSAVTPRAPAANAPGSSRARNTVLALVVASIAIGGVAFVRENERRLRSPRSKGGP